MDCLFRCQAFGDASVKINRNIIPRFFVYCHNGQIGNGRDHRKIGMKFFPFLTAVVLLHITSCSDSAENDSRTQSLQSERDSLLVLANYNQQELERMTSFFNEVSACIDSISEQEKLLTARMDIETHRRYSSKEIAMRLNQLTDIINGQRQRIASLVDSLNNRVDTLRTEGLRNTIAYLTSQLESKEIQIRKLQAQINGQQRSIRSLTSKVEDLSNTVEDLSEQNTALTEAVQVQTEIINEGYILVATRKQLKDMGIIEGGGFLKSSKVNLSNVNTSACNKVNIAVFNELPINSGKIKILSPAPASSYKIEKQGPSSTLTVTDANSFWSLSNILVIQIQ